MLSRLRTSSCRYIVQHYFQNNVAEPMNVCGLCDVSNDIEHIFLNGEHTE